MLQLQAAHQLVERGDCLKAILNTGGDGTAMIDFTKSNLEMAPYAKAKEGENDDRHKKNA